MNKTIILTMTIVFVLLLNPIQSYSLSAENFNMVSLLGKSALAFLENINFNGKNLTNLNFLCLKDACYDTWINVATMNGNGTVRRLDSGTGITLSPSVITINGTISFDTTWGDSRYIENKVYENPSFVGNLSYDKLFNFPDDCPNGQFVKGLGGTLTCATPSTFNNSYDAKVSDNTTWNETHANGLYIKDVYLKNNLTTTSSEYGNIFTVPLIQNKMNIIRVLLAQSSSVSNVAIINRAIVSNSEAIGYCNFRTITGGLAERINNILITTSSITTQNTVMLLDVDVPHINTITCSILAGSNPNNLTIQFLSETTENVSTHAGSYYINNVDL